MSRGIWHGTLVYLGLKEEPEEGYDELPERFVPEHDPHAEHAPVRPTSLREREHAVAGSSSSDTRRGVHPLATATPVTNPGNVRALHPEVHVRAVAGTTSPRVAIVDVVVFDDVEGVGSRFRTGQPVLFDLAKAPAATARRVVDFVSGLTYAARGSLTKVGKRAFLLVPDGSEISTDERKRLSELGFHLRSGA